MTNKRSLQEILPRSARSAWVMLALWSAAIWIANTRPQVPSTGRATTDHVLYQAGHFLGHVALGLLAARAATLTWGWRKRVGIVMAGALVHAVLDELVQVFVPSRDANLEDIVYNTAGVVVGFILLTLSRQRRRARS